MGFFRKILGKPVVLAGCIMMVALLVVSATQIPNMSPSPQDMVVEDISDEELRSFAEASARIYSIQEDAEKQILGIIEESGLTGERYIEIVMMENDPERETDATEEELNTALEISQKVETIDSQLHTTAINAIEEEGLTAESYQRIAMSLQASPELQDRYAEILS
ncbi:hypothetical protein CHISP_1917 [Chitinispirillum alkaliphilum]|nr:hypothetical protein CHISP_1917 [Chitinispirillum alkaliphilum]